MTAQVTPLCPHFGPCGGCQLQHLAYPAQLAQKQQTLGTLLAEAAISAPPVIQTHAANPWQYRNRIRLRVESNPVEPSTFLLGYNRAASTIFLPIHACPISAPLLLRTAQALTALASQDSAIAAWLNATAELELFTTPDESALQLTLLLHTPPALPPEQRARTFTHLVATLHQHIPQLTGAAADLLRATHANSARPRASRRLAASFTPPAWGKPGLLYPITYQVPELNSHLRETSPDQLWVSRASFFQVNWFLAETLVHLATSAFQQTEADSLAWDLFAGVGLFTRPLAAHFARVTAVESAASAIADLAAAHLPNLRIVTATVLDFLRVAALDRDRPALVLLDPPRAGLGLEAATLLTRLQPARIVYVSCDPTTLARDLRAMLSSGYILAELHLVDMFPQTNHLETIAILHRKSSIWTDPDTGTLPLLTQPS